MADSERSVVGPSDSKLSDAGELETAIAENPEAVADFVRRLDAVNELLDVVDLGTAAMTDEMVVELSGTAETLAASADGIATDETVSLATSVGENGAELQEALDTLVELQQSGTLDELAELGDVISLGTAAMTDEMVRSLAGTGSMLGELADTTAEENTRNGLITVLNSVNAAEKSETDGVGPVGLLKASRDPEIQHGLGFILTFAKALGRQQSTNDD